MWTEEEMEEFGKQREKFIQEAINNPKDYEEIEFQSKSPWFKGIVYGLTAVTGIISTLILMPVLVITFIIGMIFNRD